MRSRNSGTRAEGRENPTACGMTAKARKKIAAVRDRVQQMKSGDRAAGAIRLAIFMRQHQRWFSGAIDDARSKNSDHPAMPPSPSRTRQRASACANLPAAAVQSHPAQSVPYFGVPYSGDAVFQPASGVSWIPVVNRSTTSLAISMRPAAFSRGARRKPISRVFSR